MALCIAVVSSVAPSPLARYGGALTLITPFTWPKTFALSSTTVKGVLLPLPTLNPLPGTSNSRYWESPDCWACTLAAATMLWLLALRSCSSAPAAQVQAPRDPIAHAPAPAALHGVVAWQSLHQRRSPSCSLGRPAKD